MLLCIVSGILLAHNLYSFLAAYEPVDARVLVVEGWLTPEELDQAAQTFRQGKYERLITTGGPISGWPGLYADSDYASIAADYLANHGVKLEFITAVPAPKSAQERTFLSAVMLREYAKKTGFPLDAVDIISAGPHARRTRLLFQMALGEKIRVGIMAAQPSGFEPETWWKSSMGVETMVFQALGYVWIKCCFWPGPPGSQKELWASN